VELGRRASAGRVESERGASDSEERRRASCERAREGEREGERGARVGGRGGSGERVRGRVVVE